MLSWHPWDINLAERIKRARSDREVRLAAGQLAVHALVVHYAAHGFELPSARELARMCGVGKDFAGRVRAEALAFFARWSGKEPPPEDSPDDKESLDALRRRLVAAESRAAAAETRAAAAERAAAQAPAHPMTVDAGGAGAAGVHVSALPAGATLPTPKRHPAASRPPIHRHDNAAITPAVNRQTSGCRGGTVGSSYPLSPPHRHDNANPPPHPRQPAANPKRQHDAIKPVKTTLSESSTITITQTPHTPRGGGGAPALHLVAASDPSPPPPPQTDAESADSSGDEAITAVWSAWEEAWRETGGTPPPPPTARDRAAAREIAARHPELGGDRLAAAMRSDLERWRTQRRGRYPTLSMFAQMLPGYLLQLPRPAPTPASTPRSTPSLPPALQRLLDGWLARLHNNEFDAQMDVSLMMWLADHPAHPWHDAAMDRLRKADWEAWVEREERAQAAQAAAGSRRGR